MSVGQVRVPPDNHLEGLRGHLAIDNRKLYYGERQSNLIKEVPQ